MTFLVRGYAQSIALGLLAFFATTSVGLGFGVHWRSENRAASISLLGSGNRLSLIVTAGDARLLIAAGDDATAFGNALDDATNPTSHRIDVVIIDGTSRNGAVAARVRRDFPDATTFVIAGDLADRLSDFDLERTDVIASETRITLAPNLSITIHPPGDGRDGWWAEVENKSMKVAVFGTSVTFPAELTADVLVFTGRYDASLTEIARVRAVVLPYGASAIREIRNQMSTGRRVDYAVLVGEGTASRLGLKGESIVLPPDSIRLHEEFETSVSMPMN